jgi:hypothetical protein
LALSTIINRKVIATMRHHPGRRPWTHLSLATIILSLFSPVLVVSELTYSVTATHHGIDVDPSAIKVIPMPPRYQHMLNLASHSGHHSRPGRRKTRLGMRDISNFDNTDSTDGIDSFSSDWCGISQHNPQPSINPITGIFGIFSTPDLSLRPGGPVPQYAAAWVGIDGASCRNALLQAGTLTAVRICSAD